MKIKVLILFLVFTMGILRVFAQDAVPLYVSKQTGEATTYSGTGSKTTDKYENGICNMSSAGPILYSASPNSYSIGTNQTKTWDGKVWGDVGNAPAPGSSANAKLMGDYTVTYSKPNPKAPGGHEMVTDQKGNVTINFIVYSINVTAADSIPLCAGREIAIPATGYPEGGTYSWTAGPGLVITGGQGSETLTLKDKGGKPSFISVKYSFAGVSYTRTIKINVRNDDPTVTVDVADNITILPNEQIKITPKGNPQGGTYHWAVKGDAKLTSGPYNYVAFIKGNDKGGKATATVTYTLCGNSAKKTVNITIDPCRLDAPDVVYVLKGKTATITAQGYPEGGTYMWSEDQEPAQHPPSDVYEIEGNHLSATVTIKGLRKAEQVVYVKYNNGTCVKSKSVMVIVMDKLTIDVTPANPAILCKGNRHAFTATGTPPGGSYSWSATGPVKFNSATNTAYAWVEATGGGNASVTCTYSKDGESVSKTINFKTREIKSVTITANPNNDPLASGTAVTYTATALDQDGKDVSSEVSFQWEQVYRPFGVKQDPSTWTTIPLQGSGKTQTLTWTFSSVGAVPPAGSQMEGWVQAVVWCPVRIGTKWVKVNKP